MRKLSLPIAMLLVLAACEDAPSPTPPAAPAAEAAPDAVAERPVAGPERRILAFGDSLFAGYGIGAENSYPARLEAALRKAGINARIANAGVSGDTSGAAAQRLAFTLDAQARAPDLVLLELGGNDMLRGLPPAETRRNFEAMLGELQKRGIPVLLMGMRAPPNYGPEYQRDFDALYPALADRYSASLLPFWLEAIYRRPELFQDDRVHPTVEGIDVLVADTLDEVRAALAPR